MSENGAIDSRLKRISEFEKEILDVKDELSLRLEENLLVADQVPTHNSLIISIRYPLSLTINDGDTRENLAYDIANSLLRWDEVHTEKFKEISDNKDIVRFFIQMASRFQVIIRSIMLITRQGERFWQSIETEIVQRDSGVIGLNHMLELGLDRDEVKITTGPTSNLELASYFIGQQARLVEHYEEAAEHIDEQAVNELSKNIESLNQEINNVEE